MAMSALGNFLQNLRRSMLRQDGAGLTDGELLECFINEGDESAFEALVRLHGPMVLGVCRRIVQHEEDAEDAFQATFLVLVHRAASIRPRGMVGNWLYGVAHNTALKAKAMNHRRRLKEKEAAVRPRPQVSPADWEQLQALLDAELRGLPDKYRAAIVHCDLESMSIGEASRQLGCPQGTLGTRLARGRRMLAARLARRGLTLSGGLIAAALSENAASACVPSPLVLSTVKAAAKLAAGPAAAGGLIPPKVAALTAGVLKAMFLTRLKTVVSVVLAATLFAAAGGVVTYHTMAAEQEAATRGGEPHLPAKAPDKAKTDKDKLQGTWIAVSGEAGGKKAPEEFVHKCKVVIVGNKVTLVGLVKDEKENGVEGTFKVDPAEKPPAIDISLTNREDALGIYEVDGDTLKMCFVEATGNERPTAFTGKGQQILIVLKKSAK
jgi:RNA polymerase sigma factor (sigma-70 family)